MARTKQTARKSTGGLSSASTSKPYCLDVQAIWLEAYDSGADCDVQVKCGEESFPAHSLWLKRSIPYFAAAVATATAAAGRSVAGSDVGAGFSEGREEEAHGGMSTTAVVEPLEVTASDPFDLTASPISEDALRLVLDMVYGRDTPITAENCVEVHRAADFLGLEQLASLCVDVMIESISLANFLDITQYAIGDFARSSQVFNACQPVVAGNIDAVIAHPGFRSLSAQCVTAVLCLENTKDLPNLLGCFKLALCWVLVDPARRCEHLKTLMESICVHFVDPKKICASETYLKFMAAPDVSTCFKDLLCGIFSSLPVGLVDSNCCRAHLEIGCVILVPKTNPDNCTISISMLNADIMVWMQMSQNDEYDAEYEKVFSVAAREGSNNLFLLTRYKDIGSHGVLCFEQEKENLHYRLCYCVDDSFDHLLSKPGGKIIARGMGIVYAQVQIWFVTGSENGKKVFGVHFFDSDPSGKGKSWSFHSFEDQQANVSPESQFFTHGDQLWCSSATQIFKMVLNRGIFTPSTALLKPLFSHCLPGVTSYKGRLYLAGGCEGQKRVEFFDPVKDAWFELPSLPRSHENVHLVAAKDRLFLIDKNGPAKKVDWLDLPETAKGWQPGPDIPPGSPIAKVDDFFAVSC